MKLSLTITLFPLLAASAKAAVLLSNYAVFYDDGACTVNPGQSVDITNDGCLGETGRGSVWIPRRADFSKQSCLVKTKGNGVCSCQDEGYNFTPTGFCAVLDKDFQSYRFIEEACGGATC